MSEIEKLESFNKLVTVMLGECEKSKAYNSVILNGILHTELEEVERFKEIMRD